MGKIFVEAVVSLALLGAGSANAATVKYYSRQGLARLSTVSYTPSYGAFGTCSGGTQSAPVSTCTRSDGTVVANSFCSTTPKTQSCVASGKSSCGALVAGGNFSGGANLAYPGTVSSLAAAKSLCESTMTKAGICYVENPDKVGTSFNVFTIEGGAVASSANSWTYSAACTPS